MYKSHVRVFGTPPAESNLPTLPNDGVPLRQLDEYTLNQVAKFLTKKNMDFLMLPDDMLYSKIRMRLLVPTGNGYYSGRDLTDTSAQKWLIYTSQKYVGEVGHTTVVVEDLFSMYKVRWALKNADVEVVCSLGTALRPALFLDLIRSAKRVIMFYDGDNAGRAGATREAKRLTSAGIEAYADCAPEGLDPKDMRVASIQQHIGGYY